MKISIIIPVYNAEKTLNKCLDSIINQTYKNLEIIIINDASIDSSLDIIKKYEKENKNIILINNKENKGIGYSRNNGIKKASGDYISFIDSDDYIENNMYEIITKNINKSKPDLLIFNYNRIIKNKVFDNEYIFNNKITTFKESPEIIYNINLSPWNKIYKKELIKDVLFPEDLKYEDALFVVKSYNKAKNISIIDNKLYNYCIRDKSETSTVDEKAFDILKVSKLITEELNSYKNNIYLEAFMIRNIFRYTLQEKKQKKKKLKYKFVDEAFKFLNDYYPNWRKNKIYNKRNIFKRLIEKHKLITKLYISI